MSEAQYDPKDLSNGHYPHLRRVSEDDPEWKDIHQWFASFGIPRYARLVAPKGLAAPGDNPIMPTNIQWTRHGAPADGTQDVGDVKNLDAAMVFNFPHIALEELLEFYGKPKHATAQMYPGIRKPVKFVEYSPIGARWPERDEAGAEAYRPSQLDSEPYGAAWTDATGTYRKERRGWAFISYPVWVKVA